MKNFYVTTSIAYTNAPPHIGFSQELIQADVLARYHRLLGEDVFFLTGTDEHGKKVFKAAEEAGKIPKEFVDEISAKFRGLKKVLNLSNDDFIRTTDQKRHWPGVKKVWLKLKENGDIYKKKYKGLYCIGCEAFIKEKDLINGKCVIHQKEPEVIEEENYFFRLSKYSKQIEEAIKKDEIKIVPEGRKNEALSFIEQGLEDISCSRIRENLKWGIPVPDDDNQTIYIWLEALINYISALGYIEDGDRFKRFWPVDVHCVGKDIFKFHTLLWPAMLFSLGLKLPKVVLVHGFITVAGQKMSKSLGNVIDPFELVKKYGTDAVRYFLLREIPPTEDGDFTYEKFEQRYNSDLASGLGNLVARVLTMAEKYFAGRIPKMHKHPDKPPISPLIQAEINAWKGYTQSLENFRFDETLKVVWELISECDKRVEQTKPWELAAANKKEELEKIIFDLLENLHQISWMVAPFLPETAQKIAQALGVKELKDVKKSWTPVKSGTKIKKIESLFPRLK